MANRILSTEEASEGFKKDMEAAIKNLQEEKTISALAGIRQDAFAEAHRLESKIKPSSQFMRRIKMYNAIRFMNHLQYGAPRYGWQ